MHVCKLDHILIFSDFSNFFNIFKFFFTTFEKPKIYISFLIFIAHENDYRVSHSKPSKVILLWWGYRFCLLLKFLILLVHEKGTFMPTSSVFTKLMLCAIYGSIWKILLSLSKFDLIPIPGAILKQKPKYQTTKWKKMYPLIKGHNKIISKNTKNIENKI